ncbi:hypothetical protein [Nostoc sp. FACHB-888]|uniref:hypothetical protein n=1 Tax=Nostoc sp. FACHB-888 TaxID=2692842 RepID=UPI00168507B5|nr:hypothetical protein [Nostoc sp. FACHB-888]MBD2248995.1 hypothetical protein [Nostoc sp. FACHB-888]
MRICPSFGEGLATDSAKENTSIHDNPASATITVTAVEIIELTDKEQRDKPDGMATLAA